MTLSRKWTMPAAWIAAAAAACFFAYAFLVYRQAGAPPLPVKIARGAVSGAVRPKRTQPGLARYARLSTGRIFFGEPAAVATIPTPQPIYVSALTLRGIIRGGGQSPMAVLARVSTSPDGETWYAKPGDTVLDETVIAIEADSVVLRKDGLETVLVLPH